MHVSTLLRPFEIFERLHWRSCFLFNSCSALHAYGKEQRRFACNGVNTSVVPCTTPGSVEVVGK